ncbi:MAG: F0F1 ATP synthase subunit A [Candidatus Galacturonibacter soehngenii]|uniref:ATP synthase subunit a n=2 Tax=Candidatus Galacturonatibacter soehngenii TaxID=2307010 RepID=A0A7V7QLD4_9FIRM|nr:F0F1 ATP synthase subunit A [Candidatus Galacturonibacter soehngenii]MBA4685620.1 F0F1 ATP synthase subunit A [Candidatus Galacturonibacter soehngenii]
MNVIAGSTNFLLAEGDVDFMVHGLIKYNLFGQELWITTTHVSVLLVTISLMIFAVLVNRKIKKANIEDTPGTLQNIAELAVEMLDNMVNTIMGKKAIKYVNYIGTIFAFILFSNVSGLLGLRPPTADYGVTLPLALITFVMIQYINIKENKLGALTSLFQPIPLFFPINLIGEIATPISLSLRLFGNILSGTVMMALIYGLLPIFVKIGIPAALHIYFDLFSGAIQTYVFCMLTMVFVTDKMATEE